MLSFALAACVASKHPELHNHEEARVEVIVPVDAHLVDVLTRFRDDVDQAAFRDLSVQPGTINLNPVSHQYLAEKPGGFSALYMTGLPNGLPQEPCMVSVSRLHADDFSMTYKLSDQVLMNVDDDRVTVVWNNIATRCESQEGAWTCSRSYLDTAGQNSLPLVKELGMPVIPNSGPEIHRLAGEICGEFRALAYPSIEI